MPTDERPVVIAAAILQHCATASQVSNDLWRIGYAVGATFFLVCVIGFFLANFSTQPDLEN